MRSRPSGVEMVAKPRGCLSVVVSFIVVCFYGLVNRLLPLAESNRRRSYGRNTCFVFIGLSATIRTQRGKVLCLFLYLDLSVLPIERVEYFAA